MLRRKVGWIPTYVQDAPVSGFWASLFSYKPGGIFVGDKVVLDTIREGNNIAIAVKKGKGPNWNQNDILYTDEVTPASFSEAMPINAMALLERVAGQNIYEGAYADTAGQLDAQVIRGARTMMNKILRSAELMAAQVMQTGVIELKNADGEVVFTVDFETKATHLPTVAVDWGSASSTKLADLGALIRVIAVDGACTPQTVVMDPVSMNQFLDDEKVQKRLDIKDMDMGKIAPQFQGKGVSLMGSIIIDGRRVYLYSEDNSYKDPETGLMATYLGANKVVVFDINARRDIVSANTPKIVAQDPRVAAFDLGRAASVKGNFDFQTRVYITEGDTEVVQVVEANPIYYPAALDCFGCLTTKA